MSSRPLFSKKLKHLFPKTLAKANMHNIKARAFIFHVDSTIKIFSRKHTSNICINQASFPISLLPPWPGLGD